MTLGYRCDVFYRFSTSGALVRCGDSVDVGQLLAMLVPHGVGGVDVRSDGEIHGHGQIADGAHAPAVHRSADLLDDLGDDLDQAGQLAGFALQVQPVLSVAVQVGFGKFCGRFANFTRAWPSAARFATGKPFAFNVVS